MIVYFSVLLLICLFCSFDKKGDGRRPLLISVGLIYLMINLQEGWGGDYEAYANAFDWYSNSNFSLSDLIDLGEEERHGELGYKIMFSFMPSFQSIILLCSAFLCIALFLLLYNFVPRKYWSLFFVFLFINRHMLMGDISAIARNGFAVSLYIIALYFLSNNIRIIYLAIIIVAAFFHKSALVLLPLVFVPKRPLPINVIFGTICLVVLALVSLIVPYSWANIVGSFLEDSDYLNAYSHYLSDNEAHYELSLFIPIVIFWGYMVLSQISTKKFKPNEYMFLFIALITVIFRLLPGLGLSDRFYFYLDYGFITGILIIADKLKDSRMMLVLIVTLLFVYGRWFIMFSSTPYFALHWLRYNPVFN